MVILQAASCQERGRVQKTGGTWAGKRGSRKGKGGEGLLQGREWADLHPRLEPCERPGEGGMRGGEQGEKEQLPRKPAQGRPRGNRRGPCDPVPCRPLAISGGAAQARRGSCRIPEWAGVSGCCGRRLPSAATLAAVGNSLQLQRLWGSVTGPQPGGSPGVPGMLAEPAGRGPLPWT